MSYSRDELSRIAVSYGAKDVPRVVEGIFAAVNIPPTMTPDEACASLKRWQSNLFYGSKYGNRVLAAERGRAGESPRGVRRRNKTK